MEQVGSKKRNGLKRRLNLEKTYSCFILRMIRRRSCNIGKGIECARSSKESGRIFMARWSIRNLFYILSNSIGLCVSLAQLIIYSAAPIFRRLQNSLIKCLLFYWRIYDPDFLYVLTVHLLDLVNQHLIDQPVQHRLVQFLNSCVLPDFPDKGTDVAFLLLL